MSPRVVTCALLLGTLSSACGPHLARVRFANEFRCSLDDVTMIDLGAGSTRVTGCGRSAVYVCLLNAAGAGICSMDSQEQTMASSPRTDDVRRQMPPPPPRPRSSLGSVRLGADEVPALRLDVRGTRMILAPVAAESRPPYRLVLRRPNGLIPPDMCHALSWRADGDRIDLRADVHDSAAPEFRLSPEQMETIAEASNLAVFVCDRRVVLSEGEREQLRQLWTRVSPRQPPSVAPAPPATRPSETAEPPELRVYVDARRDAVVACAGRPAVGVVLTWSADGGVELELQTPLGSTPEEDCVRNVLRGISAPSATRAGRLIHVVQAP